MKKTTRILWGIVLVALGAVWALNACGVTDFTVFFDGWWTLFIIVPCAVSLFTERDKIGALVGVALGVVLLLCAQEIIPWGLMTKLIIPFIVVKAGLRLLFGGIFQKSTPRLTNGSKKGTAVFSGNELKFAGEPFDGATLTAVFGGIDCDLTGAIIEKDCQITAVAVFGGVDLKVPAGVNVKVNAFSLFGGAEDARNLPPVEGAPTVYVNATCIFGGVDVK